MLLAHFLSKVLLLSDTLQNATASFLSRIYNYNLRFRAESADDNQQNLHGRFLPPLTGVIPTSVGPTLEVVSGAFLDQDFCTF